MRLFYLPSADRWACLAKVLSISRKAKVNTVSKFSSLGSKSLQGEKNRGRSLYNRFPAFLFVPPANRVTPYNGPPRFALQMLACGSLCNYTDQSPPGSSVHRILQEYWSGLPFPPPRNLPYSGIKLTFRVSPELVDGFFTTEPPGKPYFNIILSLPIQVIFIKLELHLLPTKKKLDIRQTLERVTQSQES